MLSLSGLTVAIYTPSGDTTTDEDEKFVDKGGSTLYPVDGISKPVSEVESLLQDTTNITIKNIVNRDAHPDIPKLRCL